jgi:hypothetical protein
MSRNVVSVVVAFALLVGGSLISTDSSAQASHCGGGLFAKLKASRSSCCAPAPAPVECCPPVVLFRAKSCMVKPSSAKHLLPTTLQLRAPATKSHQRRYRRLSDFRSSDSPAYANYSELGDQAKKPQIEYKLGLGFFICHNSIEVRCSAALFRFARLGCRRA